MEHKDLQIQDLKDHKVQSIKEPQDQEVQVDLQVTMVQKVIKDPPVIQVQKD